MFVSARSNSVCHRGRLRGKSGYQTLAWKEWNNLEGMGTAVGERKANEHEDTRGKLGAPKSLKDWDNVE